MELSLLGTFAPWSESSILGTFAPAGDSSLELSLPGTKVPGNFRPPGAKVLVMYIFVTFATWNFRKFLGEKVPVTENGAGKV